ncbi:MAG: hypothetical protein RLZZ175_620 [Bacteroidota bacterium]|jgi:RND family efflux transporter MFP subunit
MLVYAAILSIVACTNSSENKEINNQSFTVTSPILIDTSFTNEYVADIHALKNVEIRTRIKGFIDKIHVDEGQIVKQGQLLFTINSQELKQELLRANAQLKNAIAEYKMIEVELNNTKTLVEKNIVSKSELEMVKAKLEAANAKIEESESIISSVKLNIEFASVKAPFNGIINRLPLKAGSLLDEGTLLTTISDNSEVFAYFHLSEKEYLEILYEKNEQQNQIVNLVLANGKVFNNKGKIETAESEIDKNTGNLAFRARFKNENNILKHGSSGKIALVTKLKKATIIPQKSTFEIQENNYVFTIDKNNVVSTKSIKILQRLPHLYVIESGLSTNDKILYEGIQNVKQGDKINSTFIALNKLLSASQISK